MKYHDMGGEERKATIMTGKDWCWTRPETVAAIKHNTEKHTRGKRGDTVKKKKIAKKFKEERRESAFN